MNWIEKPLKFSEILDVTFTIIKKNFFKLFLITLILIGPVLIIELFAMVFGGSSLFQNPTTGFESIFPGTTDLEVEDPFAGQDPLSVEDPFADTSVWEIVLFVLTITTYMLFSLPLTYAALIIATDHIRKNGTFVVGTVIRQALKRYWAILGGFIVYVLVAFGIITVVGVIATIITLVLMGTEMLFSGEFLQTGEIGGVILIVLLILLSTFLLIYFMTRFSFNIPAIVFEKVSPGLGKSWRLTKGFFWRLVGLYFIIFLLIMLISSVLQTVPVMFLGESVLATIMYDLSSMLSIIITTVAYAVVYFDLRVRNEAADLKEILNSYSTVNSLDHINDTSDPDQKTQ